MITALNCTAPTAPQQCMFLITVGMKPHTHAQHTHLEIQTHTHTRHKITELRFTYIHWMDGLLAAVARRSGSAPVVGSVSSRSNWRVTKIRVGLLKHLTLIFLKGPVSSDDKSVYGCRKQLLFHCSSGLKGTLIMQIIFKYAWHLCFSRHDQHIHVSDFQHF